MVKHISKSIKLLKYLSSTICRRVMKNPIRDGSYNLPLIRPAIMITIKKLVGRLWKHIQVGIIKCILRTLAGRHEIRGCLVDWICSHHWEDSGMSHGAEFLQSKAFFWTSSETGQKQVHCQLAHIAHRHRGLKTGKKWGLYILKKQFLTFKLFNPSFLAYF